MWVSTSREANSWVRAVVELVEEVVVVLVLPCPPSNAEKRKGRSEAAYTPKGGERGVLPWEESTLIAAADQVVLALVLVVVVVAEFVSVVVGAVAREAAAFVEGTTSPSLGVDGVAVAFVELARRGGVSMEVVAFEGLVALLLPNTLPALPPGGMGLVALVAAVAFEAVVALPSFPLLLAAASKRRRFPLTLTGMGAGEAGLQ